MPDLLLGDDTHDLVFINGDFQLTSNESESIRQKLIIKFLSYRGEWFLDTELGVPYFQSILGKSRSKETIDVIFQNAILEEPDVLEVSEFRSTIDKTNRIYKMSFTVRTTNDSEAVPIELTI